MSNYRRSAVLLLIAALAPGGASATVIFSDIELTARTDTRGGPAPVVVDSDVETIPNEGAGDVEALSRAGGDPFPNQPNTVGSAFASAAQLALGPGGILPGVGVNGFFLRNALFPPHTLLATASIKQSINNDSTTVTESLVGNIFIPEPTMRFFGVGDSFPDGVDLDRDASAFVQARLETKHTNIFGTIVEDTLLDYGMLAFRDPSTGVFSAKFTDGGLPLTRFEEPDGSFVFRLPELKLENFDLPDVGPSEMLEVNYIFTASAQTGFGETGIFAAIGDPFDLSGSGASFNVTVGDVDQPGPVPGIPAPNTLAVLGLGLILLSMSAKGSP
jgi:hypothetical protein